MPKKETLVGRSLIKAHKKRSNITVKEGYRHTCDLSDGRDFGRLSLNSVTEQTSLDYFLDKAALAEKDFNAEFSDIKIVDEISNGILTESEKNLIAAVQDKNKNILCIPRRPQWDSNTSKEVLDAMERESFLVWRRQLALLQQKEHVQLTPYEKNLEIWRQLWRVIERSDVIVQILDARNPLLFRCPDVEIYVKEMDERKINVLLLNKADFLTENERKCWCDYFDEAGVQIAFFSALEQMNPSLQNANDSELLEESDWEEKEESACIKNSAKILSREDLVSFLKSVGHLRSSEMMTTIGLVGYPNVGKSSTINALLMSKKVSVSATPGKTKHFQTHIIQQDLCLCDCPGLVFPNFVSTKADMIVNGILPIDQLTDWIQPISLVTSLIPKHILESTYSILIPSPGEGRDSQSLPTAEEFLNAHGYNRGFMTQRGLPDNARSARYILKDVVNGKLLYCQAPPRMKQEDYHHFPDAKPIKSDSAVNDENKSQEKKTVLTEADKIFFAKSCGVHIKGKEVGKHPDWETTDKPWKKHNNRNKKEKLRRIYRNPYQ